MAKRAVPVIDVTETPLVAQVRIDGHVVAVFPKLVSEHTPAAARDVARRLRLRLKRYTRSTG